MLLSIYYSNPDWHYEYGYNPASTHQEKARRDVKPDTHKLREYIVNQITELMTNYGPIYTLFWIVPPHIEDRSINDLVRRLQPGILINNRGFDEGDFATPEREMDAISESRHFSRLTEACNSLGTPKLGLPLKRGLLLAAPHYVRNRPLHVYGRELPAQRRPGQAAA